MVKTAEARALPDAGRFVVKHTFIEVMDSDVASGARGGLSRRVCSESALCDLVARDMVDALGQQLHTPRAEEEENVDFELRGLSETDASSEVEDCALAGCNAEVSGGSSTGIPSGSRTPECTGGEPAQDVADGAVAWGGDAIGFQWVWPEQWTNAFVFTMPGQLAAPMTDFEHLLSENARLQMENNLLRGNTTLLGSACCMQTMPVHGNLNDAGTGSGGVHAEGGARRSARGRKSKGRPTDARPSELESPVGERTTVMLRNLPNNYSRAMVLTMLDEAGFTGAFDFLYLPIDFNTHACLGYAFLNLIDPSVVPRFREVFDGFTGWMMPSRKVCRVSWSGEHQGLAAHVERYRDSPVMHQNIPDEWKPVIFAEGVRVVFPGPSKAPRAPRVRHRGESGRHHRPPPARTGR